MRKNKSFDCVEMKNAIQAELRKQDAGLSPDQIREKRQKELATSDNIVAKKWRRLPQSSPSDW